MSGTQPLIGWIHVKTQSMNSMITTANSLVTNIVILEILSIYDSFLLFQYFLIIIITFV